MAGGRAVVDGWGPVGIGGVRRGAGEIFDDEKRDVLIS